ncbi:uncharacterized protein LOC121267237 [Juglans microcarpa x Juglans regia]|uniref:uncharacterized protein LOC121267237 n=1 Tax=Juglans microcarpa x Juglans regia TaxID=2249226 RepID=UPI001B7DB063|nr:uncharacterized protein LOC121267237 [Juglans microcarpa x Juglans regia]
MPLELSYAVVGVWKVPQWSLLCSVLATSLSVFSSEDDFLKGLSREACDIDGVFYRAFHWNLDFSEEEEPSMVPVWIVLPGLPPNFYHELFLRIFTAPIGKFIKRDNPTRCVTRTDGARLCVEMDVAVQPIPFFWIGVPGMPSSRKQEIIYETLLAFCCRCKVQGHNSRTCRVRKAVNGEKTWVWQKRVTNGEDLKDKTPEIEVVQQATVQNEFGKELEAGGPSSIQQDKSLVVSSEVAGHTSSGKILDEF